MERALTSRNVGRDAQCCCGSQDCAFLAHNNVLLEGLEKDVTRAAQLGQVCSFISPQRTWSPSCIYPLSLASGRSMSLTFALQALLVRHEEYVADSERERRQMTATIESLEQEKLALEQRNAETIKANRDLLDQLEQLNDAVASSDAQMKSLTDALHSTEEELQRLSSLAARTQSLEQQLIELEREQAALQGTLDDKVADERTAMQRWRRAEKTIGDLQDQIDRIEREAREERERHVEIVARMERRMAVDGELATAAGRLKAKAGHDKAGTNVVSHFVKDILTDNATLQHGILELREMLLCSNEEVERLREQLKVHQPISSPTSEDVPTPTNLKKELGSEPVFNQELHIHHHYHEPTPKKVGSKPQVRRPKKKRYSLTPTHFTPPAPPDPSSTAAILSQTAVSIPPNTNRWSNATTLAPSSLPGSPLSISHRGSIYDRVFSDVAYDSSRPTSPSDSFNLSSPMFEPSRYQEDAHSQDTPSRHRRLKSKSLKPPNLSTMRSSSSPISLTTKSSPATAIISAISPQNSLSNDVFVLSPSVHPVIPEEEDTPTPDTEPLTSPDFDIEEAFSPTTQRRPTLRRGASHESLISVSGMDIHTLQSRPSQLLFSSTPHFASPSSGASNQPVSPWTATATATANMSWQKSDSSTLNKSLLYGSLMNQKRGINTPQRNTSAGLGKKVGGWVFGKWGATPGASTSRPESSSSGQSAETIQSADGRIGGGNAGTPSAIKRPEAKAKEQPVKLRPAGVNQNGPIWGFFDIPPTPTKVVVTDVDIDAEALGEALAEI